MNDTEPKTQIVKLLDGTFEIHLVYPVKKHTSAMYKILTTDEMEKLDLGILPIEITDARITNLIDIVGSEIV